MAKSKSNFSLTKQSLDFLKDYINNFSPVGAEYKGQKLWLDYITKYVDETFTDPYGTAVGVVNPGQKFKVVIEAHADEISWFVNYISKDGFIYLKRNGGVDHQIAPSQRVIIHGKKGPVKAVFGWPAIHTRAGKDDKDFIPKIEKLFLDCGARSAKEVEKLGIRVGSVVTYVDGFEELAYDNYAARAFDNRIGGFMISQVARLLKEEKKRLPYTLYIVNAVQEEIGLRGAEMIARRIKPDVAIITDVTHDTNTPMVNKHLQGDCSCGKGPVLTHGPAVHNKLLDFLEETAKKNKIDVQFAAVSRSTGTDTDSFAYANDGCPSALISIPLRYMHTTVEMLHKSDIENTIRLIYEAVVALKPTTNLSYFD
ncbi:MAG: M42 family metallopeptidase [Chitinophagaceae bacterium]|nr:M42 family metallopeptidase [Chitinophagaceae bacterium]